MIYLPGKGPGVLRTAKMNSAVRVFNLHPSSSRNICSTFANAFNKPSKGMEVYSGTARSRKLIVSKHRICEKKQNYCFVGAGSGAQSLPCSIFAFFCVVRLFDSIVNLETLQLGVFKDFVKIEHIFLLFEGFRFSKRCSSSPFRHTPELFSGK